MQSEVALTPKLNMRHTKCRGCPGVLSTGRQRQGRCPGVWTWSAQPLGRKSRPCNASKACERYSPAGVRERAGRETGEDGRLWRRRYPVEHFHGPEPIPVFVSDDTLHLTAFHVILGPSTQNPSPGLQSGSLLRRQRSSEEKASFLMRLWIAVFVMFHTFAQVGTEKGGCSEQRWIRGISGSTPTPFPCLSVGFKFIF